MIIFQIQQQQQQQQRQQLSKNKYYVDNQNILYSFIVTQ